MSFLAITLFLKTRTQQLSRKRRRRRVQHSAERETSRHVCQIPERCSSSLLIIIAVREPRPAVGYHRVLTWSAAACYTQPAALLVQRRLLPARRTGNQPHNFGKQDGSPKGAPGASVYDPAAPLPLCSARNSHRDGVKSRAMSS